MIDYWLPACLQVADWLKLNEETNSKCINFFAAYVIVCFLVCMCGLFPTGFPGFYKPDQLWMQEVTAIGMLLFKQAPLSLFLVAEYD